MATMLKLALIWSIIDDQADQLAADCNLVGSWKLGDVGVTALMIQPIVMLPREQQGAQTKECGHWQAKCNHVKKCNQQLKLLLLTR